MLTLEEKNNIATITNDSALRLYEYYIGKKSWKHFNPTNYQLIGNNLGWSAAKTEKCKTMLIKAGVLLIKKGSLSDGTTIYRILMGKKLVDSYKLLNEFPSEEETIPYESAGLYE